MILISRKKQIIFYILVILFGAGFIYYFFSVASLSTEQVIQTPLIVPNQITQSVNVSGVKINSDLFNSDKFKNLRSDGLTVTPFPAGKRDPFNP